VRPWAERTLVTSDEDEWELHYGPLLLGYVLQRNGKALIEPISYPDEA
jgi:hypothetical protein